MSTEQQLKYLRPALVVIGAILVTASPLLFLWPSGWRWEPNPPYEQMIFGVYATLGIFLVLASRRPLENLSLIWFTVWSSLVHGGIMAAHSIADEAHRGHLVGDVPALLLVALVFAVLTPRRRALDQAPVPAPV